MNLEALVEAASAGTGAAVTVGTVMRSYWRARERRQQAAFRAAVQQIVDASVTDLIARQSQFELRQGQHLDRQDRAIETLRKALDRQSRPRDQRS